LLSEKSLEAQELSSMYLEILHRLNAAVTPDWLHLDLTFQQMKVLYILKQNGPLKMSELHGKLGVSMPTITGIVNRLIERRDGKPLLVRETSPEDRREVRARLTSAGLEVTEMVGELDANLLNDIFVRFTEQERSEAKAFLNRFIQTIQQYTHDTTNGEAEAVENKSAVSKGAKRNRRIAASETSGSGEAESGNLMAAVVTNGVTRRFDTYSTRPILT
jgi:DNA-binding MarR family transcriptional regulator